MKTIKIKLNTDLNGFKKGEEIELRTDSKGNVKDLYWNRRIEDSKIDNCVEIITKKAKAQAEKNK